MAKRKVKQTLPLIPVRGLVIFPYMVMHFDVVREKSIAALEAAMAEDQLIFLVTQKDNRIEQPGEDDIYTIGTVSRIKQLLKLPGDSIRVLIEGVRKAEIVKYTQQEPCIYAQVVELPDRPVRETDVEVEAIVRQIQDMLDQYFKFNNKYSEEMVASVKEITDPAYLTDVIASNILLKTEDKIEILSEADVKMRLVKTVGILSREIEVWSLEFEIMHKVRKQMDQNQREYFLREQMKAIEEELGDKDGIQADIEEYKDKIVELDLPEEVELKCRKELQRLSKLPYASQESGVIKAWLDCVVDLPWNKETKEELNLNRAERILQRDHYGLDKVKDRIIENLAVRKLNEKDNGTLLCLVGPPGVGKTSIARSLAEACGRNYVRISLGGVRDEAEIRGHRKTYVGAMPGRIISALKQAQSRNPLLLLDEIDKMSNDFRGDPSAALLEVLDGEQNKAFVDHYLEVPFDLSNVMFILTANTLETIPRPLLDRMEVISIDSYTEEEKKAIAKQHLLPKQMGKHGLQKENLRISDGVMEEIIASYTREAGVRNLERQLATICRKAAKSIVAGEKKTVSVTKANLDTFLGKKKYSREGMRQENEIGVVTGLAYTQAGGDTLSIEVNIMDGTGKVELTGSLGDVMKESAKAAISYIRSQADTYKISGDFYKKKDIHIHVPEGATPKDGPSAGVTMATALLSALTNRPVRRDVAMTGEITLRGRVLAIGGLKEKSMAAYRIGIKTVYIPWENKKDIEELPQKVKEAITFVPVKNVHQIISAVLLPKENSGLYHASVIPPHDKATKEQSILIEQ